MSFETQKLLDRYYQLWLNRKDRRIDFWRFVQLLRSRSGYFDVSKQSMGDEIDVILARKALGTL